MPWKIVDGQPQRARVAEVFYAVVSPEIKPDFPPSEMFVCDVCEKTYKTERGLYTHLATH